MQACYLQIPLPVEFMHFDTIFGAGKEGMRISCVADYPIKTLVLESNHLKTMMEVLAEICSCLQEKLIPYNLLISDHGKRIFLFFQVNGIWFCFHSSTPSILKMCEGAFSSILFD